jgi:hypothetical protein
MHRDDYDSADQFARAPRRSWARLLKRVYQADPVVCPRCPGPLKILSRIEDAPLIEKILRHLKLWDRPERPPPPPAAQRVHYGEEFVDPAGPDAAGDWPDATA